VLRIAVCVFAIGRSACEGLEPGPTGFAFPAPEVHTVFRHCPIFSIVSFLQSSARIPFSLQYLFEEALFSARQVLEHLSLGVWTCVRDPNLEDSATLTGILEDSATVTWFDLSGPPQAMVVKIAQPMMSVRYIVISPDFAHMG
jgi:hypothetical protein